jgi:hypothetical protein
MRIATGWTTLAFLIAAPLAAQSSVPLKATLTYNESSAETNFESNKPAYFALFDVTRQSMLQVYPAAQYEYDRGGDITFGRVNWFHTRTNSYFDSYLGWGTQPYGPSGGWPTGWLSQASAANWGGFGGNWLTGSGDSHTLLLVASTSPLNVSAGLKSQIGLRQVLFNKGYRFRLDSDDALDALIESISPSDPEAEVAIDWVVTQASPLMVYEARFNPRLSLPYYGYSYCYSAVLMGYYFVPSYYASVYCSIIPRNLLGGIAQGPAVGAIAPSPTSPPTTIVEGVLTKKAEDMNGTSGRKDEAIRQIYQTLKDADERRVAGYVPSPVGGAGTGVVRNGSDGGRTRIGGSGATDASGYRASYSGVGTRDPFSADSYNRSGSSTYNVGTTAPSMPSGGEATRADRPTISPVQPTASSPVVTAPVSQPVQKVVPPTF